MFILLGHVYSELSCFTETPDPNKSWVWSSAIGMTKIILVHPKFQIIYVALSIACNTSNILLFSIASYIVIAIARFFTL